MSKPRFSQHFLRSPAVRSAILRAARLEPEDRVLEIGPGRGALTLALANQAQELTAVEIDPALAENMRTRFAGTPHRVVTGDILRVSLDALFGRLERPIKIVGNLPYAVTSPILEKILPWPHWERAVLLVQREVAHRMAARPGSRIYGILSLAVQLYARVEKVMGVTPEAFSPRPGVDSTVVVLTRLHSCPLPKELEPDFFHLAHAAFQHRRKKLANSLVLATALPKPSIEKWLSRHGLPDGIRAEALDLATYVRLSHPWSIFRREET